MFSPSRLARSKYIKYITSRSRSSVSAATQNVYVEETVIPTYHFQESLPKLPIPELNSTHKKFEYFAKPMLSADLFSETKKLSDEFFTKSAVELQAELKRRDKSEYSSYISRPWFDMYLKLRDPVMINVNPQITFNDSTSGNPEDMKQAQRAANLIYSSLRFYKTLQDEKLSPDIFHTKPKQSETDSFKNFVKWIPRKLSFYGAYWYGAFPLDMSQYKNLFSSTRIPKKGKDELKKFSQKDSRHIIVQHGPHFFKIEVIDESGNIASKESIKAAFDFVLSQPIDKSRKPIGVLTSMDRDKWADTRAELLSASAKNEESMKAIDSALFAVCLDDSSPSSFEDIAYCMLHGDATNRWFDKSFQLIVAKNGKASVNFEHSWGDGVAVLRYFNGVFDDVKKVEKMTTEKTFAPHVSEVSFDLNDNLNKKIDNASNAALAFIKSIDLATLDSNILSKSFCKTSKLGADGVIQTCFQLGHYLLHDCIKPTYESASTSAFKHGRTETIRSATQEAKEFVESIKNSKDAALQRDLLAKTVANHGKITKNALMGEGIDRHLFGLKYIAEDTGKMRGNVEAFLTGKGMQEMNHWGLSTSTLSSPALYAGGFGPVNADCYSIAYGVNDDGFRTAITSYRGDSKKLGSKFEEAADIIKKLVLSK